MYNPKENKTQTILGFIFGFAFSILLSSCPIQDSSEDTYPIQSRSEDTSPIQGGSEDTIESETKNIELSFYPGTEVEFHDTYTLFCTTVQASSLDVEVNSFDITLNFDSSTIAFESVFSMYSTLDVTESDGSLRLQASKMNMGPGEYIELCTITWKALRTGITDILLNVNGLLTTDGKTIPTTTDYYPTIRILKQLGSFSFDGPNSVDLTKPISEPILLSIENNSIREYDIDIVFDSSKMTLIEDPENFGVECGLYGNIKEVVPGNGIINIKGSSASGIGPGSDLDLFTIKWNTIDSGRPFIFIDINKVVTKDDVYIKPTAPFTYVSIIGNSKRPIVLVWLDLPVSTIAKGEYFITYVYLNLYSYPLYTYGIDIKYDPKYIKPDTSDPHPSSVQAGADGFLAAANPNEPSVIHTAGYEVTGKNPSPDFQLLKIYWKAIEVCASTRIKLKVKGLTTSSQRPIDRINVTEENGWPVTVTN